MSNHSRLANLRLGFAGAAGCSSPHLSVDGMTPRGPNLSHWPGNRTPGKWKADLSTGIALRFARSHEREQAEFLGDAALVVNDHYDTDGFGALLAVLRRDVAMTHEELLLAAAATGDFGAWQTPRAFAIDRIVAHLADTASPVAREFAGARGPDDLSLRRYAWLLDHAETVLRHSETFTPLYEEEMATVQHEIDDGLRGGIDHRCFDELALAVLRTRGDRHRMTLNTLAGAFRVLHVQTGGAGPLYRYHDRTESWFELVTFHAMPRRDLRPLAAHLAELEPARDGAEWVADAPTEPIPELYFGVPSRQDYGAITRELRPSKLAPERVIGAFAAFFADGPPRTDAAGAGRA